MLSEEICEKLQRLVIDENKIVTCKTLSRSLNIPINSAKKFLESFLNTYKADNNLGAYYVIIGTQSDALFKQCSKAVIVPEKDVNSVKLTFTSVTSSHVYCIYKGNLVDKCAIYTTEYGQDGDSDFNKLAVINNPNAKIQSRKICKPAINNAAVNETKKAPPPAVTPPVEPKKPQPVVAPTKKSPDIFNMLQKVGEKNKSSTEKSKLIESSKRSLPPKNAAAPFGSAKGKQKPSPKNEAAATKNKGDVKSMFSKQAERNALKPVKSSTPIKDDEDFQLSIKSSSKIEAPSKAKKITSQKKKKLPVSDDSDSETLKPKRKKHRRIVTADDSESSSDNEEAHDKAQRDFFNVEPSVPEAAAKILSDNEDDEPIPPTPVDTGKKKSLKVVTKTFEDELGFFVTKKVKEYVTDSEESDSEKKVKPIASPPKKTNTKTLLANKKQASLTSFFKQK